MRDTTRSAETRPRAANRGPLWPREHGAYGQLGLPLVAALGLGTPNAAGALLAAGSIGAFVAHEPLLVAIGARGPRARREHGPRARVVGASLALVAGTLGAAAITIGGRAVLVASIPPAALALLVLPLSLTGREKTTPGELLAGVALASPTLPIAVAGGASTSTAWGALAAWAVALSAGTAAVRWVIARHRGQQPWYLAGVVALATAGGAALYVTGSTLAWAALPMIGAAWVLVARPPHPRNLRRVGWTLIACSTATAIGVVALARLQAG